MEASERITSHAASVITPSAPPARTKVLTRDGEGGVGALGSVRPGSAGLATTAPSPQTGYAALEVFSNT